MECAPTSEAQSVWNCPKCYPRMCSCPLTKEQKIESRILALSESVWNDEEKAGFRKELARMMPKTERQRRLRAALETDSYSSLEKTRLNQELQLLDLDLAQIDYRTSSNTIIY